MSMLQETWNLFPRQIVQRINGLLDQAQPTRLKSFHLYKMCQSENLWSKSFSEFSYLLENYYHTHPAERSKSQIDQFLDRPMDWRCYENVSLTFHSAEVHASEIRDIASWAHHMLRLHYEKTSPITSIETLGQTIFDLTHPSFGEKDQNFDFEDFCNAWKEAVDKLFGKKYEFEHKTVLADLRKLNQNDEALALQAAQTRSVYRIYLTQTEIDWVSKVLSSVQKKISAPRYPLSKGPTKTELIDLLKWVTLWEISKNVNAVAVQDKVLRLQTAILNECEFLLASCRR